MKDRFRRLLKWAWRSKGLHWFLGSLLALYLRLLKRTMHFTVNPPDALDRLEKQQPAILAMWHGQHFMVPIARRKTMRFATLISSHGDGEVNAVAARQFGIHPIRGSGGHEAYQFRNRGGAKALRAMLRTLEQGISMCFTADVPKVARVTGEGIVLLARISGRPIIPTAIVSARYKAFKSWDRACIGLPFSKGAIVLGDPVFVPQTARGTELDQFRLMVEQAMDRVHEQAYSMLGAVDPGGMFAQARKPREAVHNAAETA
jgi:lysophospholipid acyltransferase (LPLAT)-like uncharacterized protein